METLGRELLIVIVLGLCFLGAVIGMWYGLIPRIMQHMAAVPSARLSVSFVERGFSKGILIVFSCSRTVNVTVSGPGFVHSAVCGPRATRAFVPIQWVPGKRYVFELWYRGKVIARRVTAAPRPSPAIVLSNVSAVTVVVPRYGATHPGGTAMAISGELCTRDNPRIYLCFSIAPGAHSDWRYISVEIVGGRVPWSVERALTGLWRSLGLERARPGVDPSRLVMVDVWCSRAPLSTIFSKYVVYGAVYIYVGPMLGGCYRVDGRIARSSVPNPYTQVFPSITVYTGISVNASLRLGTSTIRWVAPLIKPWSPVLVARVGQGYVVWIPAKRVGPGVLTALYRVILFRYWLHPYTRVFVINASYAAWCRHIVELPMGLRNLRGLYTVYVTAVGNGVASYAYVRYSR